ncbi:class I SAM-dependent methyltransferase [Candidatus Woesearchaeota archaeon]|nr:class I SAM-dependent methyltransferase [Candidatus Woesearchaeota archaeon]
MIKRRVIPAIDRGKDFGDFGADAQRLFIQETGQHIEPLCHHIRTQNHFGDHVALADVGGGNGILAKAVLAALGKEYPYLTVDLFDIDESKFANGETRIAHIVHDAYYPLEKQYDALIARSMLHYNTPAEQRHIISEMAAGTQPGGLVTIVQPIPVSAEDKKEVNGLYRLLCTMKGISQKHWLRLPELVGMVQEAGLSLHEVRVLEDGFYTIDGFYKRRYALSHDEVTSVRSSLAGREGICMPTSIITALKR